jgi:hypothetical protein
LSGSRSFECGGRKRVGIVESGRGEDGEVECGVDERESVGVVSLLLVEGIER